MKFLVFVLAIALGAFFGGTASGATVEANCEMNAVVLKMSTSEQTNVVTLVKAYDPETQTYDATNFVYYCKVNLERGKAYSLWLTGPDGYRPDPGLIDFYDIYPREADPDKEEFEPGAMFLESSGKWKPGSMQVMTEDEWYIDEDDPEMSDPKYWDYYVHISGTNAMTATLHYQQANALPLGIEDNPLPLTVTTSPRLTTSRKFVEGEYSFAHSADVTSGRRYLFAALDGEESNPYFVSLDTTGKLTPYSGNYGEVSWKTDECNDVWAFDPDTDGPMNITVSETNENTTALFRLRYAMLPTRTLAEHNPQDLAVGTNGVLFVPGRINAGVAALGKECYDVIIDQALFRCTQLKKGVKYVAETNGSKTNLLMRVYNGTGDILYESTTRGDGTYDVRCGFVPSYNGTFYIGVCQDLDDDDLDELMPDNEVKLTIEEVVSQAGVPDAWDDADDTYVGATMLAPVRGIKWVKPSDYDEKGTGWHQLGKSDWYDTYRIPVRAGLGYGISVTFESESETELSATVFQMSGKSEVRVSKVYGDVNPSSTSGLFFAPEKNGVYYIRLSTSGTYGLHCPRYKVHTIVYHDTELNSDHVGLLHVDAKGCPEAIWTLGSESLKYPLGTTIALPIATNRTTAAYTVKFGTVKDFNVKPASTNVTLYAEDEQTAEAFAVYSDKYDPKDDVESGAFSWSLSNKEKTESRTLWTGDGADYFALTGKDGYYYDIVMKQSEGGDAVFSILHDGETLCAGVTNVHQFVLPTAKTKYYLKVEHQVPASPKDTSYSLSGFYANVGAIKFAKAEYKVKENAASVTLTMNRTAKDGKVRVRLSTVDGAWAKGIIRGETGDEKTKFYKLEDLVLAWGDGDNKAKNVTIDLIPDLRPLFHDVTRAFTVELADAKDGNDSFYPASFVGGGEKAETKVVLSEIAKKAPGTVQVANSDNKDPKKPEFTVTAGSELTIAFNRIAGSYGDISVTCDTSALDGKAPNLQWNGDTAEPQFVTVHVPEATDRKASAKYTVRLKANTGDGLEKATLAASSVTINALNQQFAQTMSDYAKALPKTCGYTIKEGKSGTWFVMEDGSFTNFTEKGALTFTATGPCTASYKYIIHGEESEGFLLVAPGKRDEVVIPDGAAWASFEYSFNGVDGYETIYQAVQYGYAEPIVEDGAEVKAKVAVGKLPDGIKLEQDRATKAWYVRGVPTKAGFYYAEIQDTAVRPAVPLTNFAFKVVALRSAIGTFNGLVTADDESKGCSTNRLQSLAQVTLTTAANGKLSAKAAIGGKTYSFTSTGFASAEPLDPDDEDSEVMLEAELIQVQKIKSQAYTNTLQVTLVDMEADDSDAWGKRATLELDMAALPDLKGSGFQEDISYKGRAYRDNSKVAEWVLEASRFAGYYTTALVPMNASVFELGEPGGNGYLTMTIDAKGKVKLTGALANGTAYSASSLVGNLDGIYNDDTGEEDPAVIVPIYSFKSPTLFGGWLTVRFPSEGAPVVMLQKDQIAGVDDMRDDDIRWISADAAGSYAGIGFDISLAPAGGYYDTVANLQRYYLNNAFFVEFPDEEDLCWLREILRTNYGEGYDFVAEANPNEQSVDVVGDTISVEKQALAKTIDPATGRKTAFNDWANCVNAANVKVSFKRATGIVTGTCDLWYEGTNTVGAVIKQGKLSGLKHAGVLLMNRDEDDADVMQKLPEDVWTAGAVVIPQSWKEGRTSRKWNASFPFNIKAEEFED